METECDVIVLGSGAAGLAAALAAHESGARVRVIERFDRVGGTAAVSGGVIWAANNPRQRAAGLPDSREEALAYFGALDHGDIQRDLLEAFVDGAPDALEFLESIDALRVSALRGYPDYYLDRPGAKPDGGRALDQDLFALPELGPWAARIYAIEELKPLMLRETPLGGASDAVAPAELRRRVAARECGFGQALIARLLKTCLERGLEPELNVRTTRLTLERGRVCGIEAERDGAPFAVRASRGVILATGGFEWDPELRQTFLRGPADTPASPPTARGEGLGLAMAVGAKLGNMTSAWWAPTLALPGDRWPGGEQRAGPVLIERTLPHSLIVNRAGKRFCNEAANYSALAGAFHAFDPQTYAYPNQPAWLVFDQQYRKRYSIGTAAPGTPVPAGVIEAATLEKLAELTGVDGAALATTITRFNRFADEGCDADFARGTNAYDRFYGDRSRAGAAMTLGAVAAPPFFAVEIRMGMLGTNGGPRTDAEARVLDHRGVPIAGLFGAGNVIASPTGGVYAGAGGTLGPALTFGYLAGRSAAAANVR